MRRLVEAVGLVLLLAFGVQLAAGWLWGALPALLVLGAVVGVVWLAFGWRRPSGSSPFDGRWP